MQTAPGSLVSIVSCLVLIASDSCSFHARLVVLHYERGMCLDTCCHADIMSSLLNPFPAADNILSLAICRSAAADQQWQSHLRATLSADKSFYFFT